MQILVDRCKSSHCFLRIHCLGQRHFTKCPRGVGDWTIDPMVCEGSAPSTEPKLCMLVYMQSTVPLSRGCNASEPKTEVVMQMSTDLLCCIIPQASHIICWNFVTFLLKWCNSLVCRSPCSHTPFQLCPQIFYRSVEDQCFMIATPIHWLCCL